MRVIVAEAPPSTLHTINPAKHRLAETFAVAHGHRPSACRTGAPLPVRPAGVSLSGNRAERQDERFLEGSPFPQSWWEFPVLCSIYGKISLLRRLWEFAAQMAENHRVRSRYSNADGAVAWEFPVDSHDYGNHLRRPVRSRLHPPPLFVGRPLAGSAHWRGRAVALANPSGSVVWGD